MLRIVLILGLLGTVLPACSNQPPPDVERTEPGLDPGVPSADQADEMLEEEDAPDAVSGVGTIVYVDLEGGFYGLVDEDGTKYNPLNLDDAFKEDSLSVRFRGTIRRDVMTTRMWGKNLHILNMVRLTVGEDG